MAINKPAAYMEMSPDAKQEKKRSTTWFHQMEILVMYCINISNDSDELMGPNLVNEDETMKQVNTHRWKKTKMMEKLDECITEPNREVVYTLGPITQILRNESCKFLNYEDLVKKSELNGLKKKERVNSIFWFRLLLLCSHISSRKIP